MNKDTIKNIKSAKPRSGGIGKFFSDITKKAEVDWIVILFVSFIVTVTISIWAWSKYEYVSRSSERVSGGDVDLVELNDSGLQKVKEEFEIKKGLSEALKKGYNGAGDPSL